jgi:hypothetical protein
MGLFKVPKDASVEKIMKYAQLYPGDEPFQHHHEVYDPVMNTEHALNDRFLQRKLFELEKGKKGSKHEIRGERLGWIDYGPREAETDVLAEVAVPIKRVGRTALKYETVTISIDDIKADLLENVQPKDDDAILLAFIGRAVQIAADGRHQEN